MVVGQRGEGRGTATTMFDLTKASAGRALPRRHNSGEYLHQTKDNSCNVSIEQICSFCLRRAGKSRCLSKGWSKE